MHPNLASNLLHSKFHSFFIAEDEPELLIPLSPPSSTWFCLSGAVLEVCASIPVPHFFLMFLFFCMFLCQWKSEDSICSPGARVRRQFELSVWVLIPELWFSERAPVLLSSVLSSLFSLQPFCLWDLVSQSQWTQVVSCFSFLSSWDWGFQCTDYY